MYSHENITRRITALHRRDEMAKSVPETLAAVKAMGYDYVEPAGLFGYSYADFKAELDKAGLKAHLCARAVCRAEGGHRKGDCRL